MDTVNIMDDARDPTVLFIFTDGSFVDFSSSGAAMATLYTGSNLDKLPIVGNCIRLSELYSSTAAELYAMVLGLSLAQSYIKSNNKIKRIYLLSDSKVAVTAFREWIYNWKYNAGMYLGYKNKEMMNAQLYTEALTLIDDIGYPIFFYHIKGHSYSDGSRLSVYTVLNKFNYLNNCNYDESCLETINYFSKCNHEVDTMPDNGYNHELAITPIRFKPDNESMYETLGKYEQLQGGTLHGFDEEIWN